MRYIKILIIIFRNAYIRDIKIPGVVIFNLVISLLEIFMTIVLFKIIFDNIDALAGWNYYQVLFLFSMMKFTTVLSGMFYRKGLGSMASETVRRGDYDFYLIKPANPMIMISIREPRVYHAITLVAVLCLAVYSALKSSITISAVNILWFVVLLALGQILYYFLTVISIVPTFWFVRLYSLRDVMNRALQFARYPAGIYSKSIQIMLFALFPILATTYLPATTLFNPPKYQYIIYLLVITVVFGLIATKLWRLGEKHYGSASS